MITEAHPAKSKALANRVHARRRAAERHDIDLSPDRIEAVEAGIRGVAPGHVQLGDKYGGENRELWAVKEGDGWLPVVYDRATGTLVTVLPARAIDPYRGVLEPVVPPAPAWKSEATGPVILGVGGPFAAFPPLAQLKPNASYEEILDAIDALAARRAAVEEATRNRGYKRSWAKAFTVELKRLGDLLKELKRRKHEAYLRCHVAPVSPGCKEPEVLAALYATAKGLASRLGWESLAPEEQAAFDAAKAFLDLLK